MKSKYSAKRTDSVQRHRDIDITLKKYKITRLNKFRSDPRGFFNFDAKKLLKKAFVCYEIRSNHKQKGESHIAKKSCHIGR